MFHGKWTYCCLRRRYVLVPAAVISFQSPYPQLVFVTFSSESVQQSYHNKIPELDGLDINTVLSMNHPLGVPLHSAQSPSAACVLAELPCILNVRLCGMKNISCTLCDPLFALNEMMQSYIITACTVTNNECAIRSHVAIYCAGFFFFSKKVRGDGRYLCRMHVKSGTKQAFSGSHTKLCAGQRAFFLHPLSHEPLLQRQSPLCVPMALGESTQSFEIAFERWDFLSYPSFSCLLSPLFAFTLH